MLAWFQQEKLCPSQEHHLISRMGSWLAKTLTNLKAAMTTTLCFLGMRRMSRMYSWTGPNKGQHDTLALIVGPITVQTCLTRASNNHDISHQYARDKRPDQEWSDHRHWIHTSMQSAILQSMLRHWNSLQARVCRSPPLAEDRDSYESFHNCPRASSIYRRISFWRSRKGRCSLSVCWWCLLRNSSKPSWILFLLLDQSCMILQHHLCWFLSYTKVPPRTVPLSWEIRMFSILLHLTVTVNCAIWSTHICTTAILLIWLLQGIGKRF